MGPDTASFGLQLVLIWGPNFLAAFVRSSVLLLLCSFHCSECLLLKCSRANGVINTGDLGCYWPWPWERRAWGRGGTVEVRGEERAELWLQAM